MDDHIDWWDLGTDTCQPCMAGLALCLGETLVKTTGHHGTLRQRQAQNTRTERKEIYKQRKKSLN